MKETNKQTCNCNELLFTLNQEVNTLNQTIRNLERNWRELYTNLLTDVAQDIAVLDAKLKKIQQNPYHPYSA